MKRHPSRSIRITNAATGQEFVCRNRARRHVKHGRAQWVDRDGSPSDVETSAISFVEGSVKKTVKAAVQGFYVAARLPKATKDDLKHTPVVMAHKLYRVGNDRMPVRSPRCKSEVIVAGGVITTTVERSSKVVL